MHWGDFFKGSFFATFLILVSCTFASLAYQTNESGVIVAALGNSSVTKTELIAQAPEKETYGQFPQVLSAATSSAKNINVLLLGLDSRKDDKSSRCDAIHMLSFKPSEKKIIITSVPRGTPISIPNTSSESAYISNACSIMGFTWAQAKIEKITGIKADYVVKVGFSQTLGALRLANLPTTPILQFLRDRKNYLLGDYQRSYNQATFLKDMFINNFDKLTNLPEPIQYLGFKLADTDLTFDEAKKIIKELKTSEVSKNPDQVEIVVRPKDGIVRQDIHFENKDSTWENNPEYLSFQADITKYLVGLVTKANIYIEKNNLTAARQIISLAYQKQLWLQVENSGDRNQLHWELLKANVLSSSDKITSLTQLQDFILEMDQMKQTNLKNQAKELLALI